jgi:hypothetical protein
MAEAATAIGPEVTNGGEEAIQTGIPYTAEVTIEGVADLLFHRWNVEAIADKSAAAKGSKAKKSDNVESYVCRDDDGFLCLPGEYLRQALIGAAKFRQDPRSPRKSAMDLCKAGIASLTPTASLGVKEWNYEHKARVIVQRQGVTRTRPAMKAGWKCTVTLMIVLPEYISSAMLQGLLADAGRLIGVGDFRPTYGRFSVIRFDLAQ